MTDDRTYWLLGLPFDAVDMEQAVQRIHAAAASRRRLIVVTPNVNFVSMAGRDAQFRQAILESQLSLVDGMPLVWLGRATGIPFRQRVAGSSLLLRMAAERTAPLRIFFFGGEPGIAELAASRIRDFGPGLVVAGFLDPGFGSIDSMSTPEIIEAINVARPDVLLLSFGAKKGHQWIARNHGRIDAPVITNLGAAINFIAGSVRRSPGWMQGAGLEWVWRIWQEPKLFSRYWNDGIELARALWNQPRTRFRRQDADRFRVVRDSSKANHWSVNGPLTAPTVRELESVLYSRGPRDQQVQVVDLAGVTELDAAGLGLLYASQFRWEPGQRPVLVCSAPGGMRLLQMHKAECLLSAIGRV
jgi:N-acetylglucosaminyldiphosphoundecaprenol N-acetyl-beta-D-mannosaminyltransferase